MISLFGEETQTGNSMLHWLIVWLQTDLFLHPQDSIRWNAVWKLKLPNKLKYFVWLVLHNKILTNSQRLTICNIESALCEQCSNFKETTLHALRDCINFTKVWEGINGNIDTSCVNITDWIKCNIFLNSYVSNDYLWYMLFCSVIWTIWKCRNEFIFNS